MWSKGYAAEETKAAFARARELTAGTENPAERFVAYFAQWAGSHRRGEFALARGTAETFRREAENEGRATERVVGLRMLGLTCLLQGDFIEARAHLKEALRAYDPERDRHAKFRFGQDAARRGEGRRTRQRARAPAVRAVGGVPLLFRTSRITSCAI
jgi:hypothetical protein